MTATETRPREHAGPGTVQAVLPISGMTCANCAARIERGLRRTAGVARAAVNLASAASAGPRG